MTLSFDLLIGAKSAALFTGLTERAIYHLVAQDAVPYFRKGTRLYFRKSELIAAFASPCDLAA